ncbi:MAG: PqqD family protein [Candidatus Omnitrophica bacterium]|nr:PqqD family protein [Candidatus Omnitrophota bacterium]
MATKLTLNTVCAIPKDDVVAREIHGEFIIVPVTAGIGDSNDDLYSTNETGRAIWDRLDGKRSLKDNADELSLEFEVNKRGEGKEEIQGDVLGFTGELLKRRMVIDRKEGNRKQELGDRGKELGDKKQELGNRKQELGEERKETEKEGKAEKAEAEKQEKEISKKKKKWVKPQLIVLVRGKPEEMVLNACKSTVVYPGPDNNEGRCKVLDVAVCVDCSDSTPS